MNEIGLSRPEPEADRLAEGWRPYPNTGNFLDLVGPLYYRKDAGGDLKFGFRCLPRHRNPSGSVHGGMLMTVMDQLLGNLVWHKIGKKPSATVSLNCDFVAAAQTGDWVEGAGEVVRQGVSLVFVRGELTVGARAILNATGIWKVIGAS